MSKSNSGQKLSEIAEEKMSGIEEKIKNGRPIRGEEFGHVIDQNNNNNKNSPENDRNNVAFYKREKREKNEKDKKKEKFSIAMFSAASSSCSTSLTSETSIQSESSTSSTKTWADVVGSYKQSSLATKTSGRRVTKTEINPDFRSEDPGYDRIVVSPTHFNNKTFKGFVTQEQADTIRKAINLNNHHGTTFYRTEDDRLFITFKLAENMSLEEIKNSVHKFFWFDKESREGNWDIVSGQVVHPEWETNPKTQSGDLESSKEVTRPIVKIEGINYRLTEDQILSCFDEYGVSEKLEEEALVTPKGEQIGTGNYLLHITLNKSIPNILPIYGLKITVSYDSIKKQCKTCFSYHKKESKCEKKSFKSYIDEFKELHNPCFPLDIAFEDKFVFKYQ